MSRFPKYWNSYIQISKSQGLPLDSGLANFASRWGFARNLTAIELDGYSPNSAIAYCALTRLAFAYSSLDALEVAISHRIRDREYKHPVIHFETARMARSGALDKLFGSIIDSAEPDRRRSLEKRLSRIRNAETDDVRDLIEGLRNSYFHGRLNPNNAGISSSRRIAVLLNDLADEVLKSANDLFIAWVKTLSRV